MIGGTKKLEVEIAGLRGELKAAMEIARLALEKATDAKIEVLGIKASTHRVVVTPQAEIDRLEKTLMREAGVTNEDFDTDLRMAGMEEDPESLV